MRPAAAFVEIVERRKPGTLEEGMPIKPNEIRINGIPLLCPRDQTITVHEIDLEGDDVVQVTLTLFARRVVIAEESIEENQS
jgi:hypothetical protein